MDWDREGPSYSHVPPSGLGTKGSEAIVLDSWAVGLETMVVATQLYFWAEAGPQMLHNLARSWLFGGGCISPQPLIWPQQIPFVGDLQHPGDLPQVVGAPTIENWPDAAGTTPEKRWKDQVFLNMVRSQDRKIKHYNRIREEEVLKD